MGSAQTQNSPNGRGAEHHPKVEGPVLIEFKNPPEEDTDAEKHLFH